MIVSLTLLAVALDGAGPERVTIGVYQRWAAFADARPRRCYAISRAVTRGGGYADIGSWPGTTRRGQFHARLSRMTGPDVRVTLSVGERRFALVTDGAQAWGPDTRTDRAIVAAMRAGRSMSVEAADRARRPFADVYTLGGAASAIDAAALGCLGR